jgi:hypothetical protein
MHDFPAAAAAAAAAAAGTVLEALLAWALLNSFGWRPLLLASVGPLGDQQQHHQISSPDCAPLSFTG